MGTPDQVQSVFEAITARMKELSQNISQIALASQEQSVGISQIGEAVLQMDTLTQSNAAASEQTAAASTELASQADLLQTAVGELKVLVDGQKKKNARFAAQSTSHSGSIRNISVSPPSSRHAAAKAARNGFQAEKPKLQTAQDRITLPDGRDGDFEDM